MCRNLPLVPLFTLLTLATALPPVVEAQAGAAAMRLEARPSSLSLIQGEEALLEVVALDAAGGVLDVPLRVVAPRDALAVRGDRIAGLQAGNFEVVVTTVEDPDGGREPLTLRVPVTVAHPPVSRVEVEPLPGAVYVGSRLAHQAAALHADGSLRPRPQVRWSSSDPGVASVDRFGNVEARAPGTVRIAAEVEGVRGELEHTVFPLRAVSLELEGGAEEARTGDVLRYRPVALDAEGRRVEDLVVTWALAYTPDDSIVAPAAPGQVAGGRVVADVPGVYTVIATAGPLTGTASFRAVPRRVVQRVEVVGRSEGHRLFTTDFWVYEGVDGRDYALTGSRFTDGMAYAWDVTDPSNIVLTDSVSVDARIINDVKVSPDGRYATMTREGASNRRNGLVLLDLAEPAHPRIASVVDEGLTGGVHNAFPTNGHAFVLSAGEKYLIIDVSDLYNPRVVSEVQHGECRIHDVWVHDGIAYSAQWGCGVIAYDVGNGGWGGSVENPVFISRYEVPSQRTHAVFPYLQESTGRFLLFLGDEIVNRDGKPWAGTGPDHRQPYDPATGTGGYPRATSGYIQVVDFTDPDNPEMIARYHVEEYGTHNIWVADDKLYQAYYEGGLRVVDVSGELMGNLYSQGREIAVFKAQDPVGYVANSPGAWSAMPHKGLVYFSDINSGIWAVRLLPGEDSSVSP